MSSFVVDSAIGLALNVTITDYVHWHMCGQDLMRKGGQSRKFDVVFFQSPLCCVGQIIIYYSEITEDDSLRRLITDALWCGDVGLLGNLETWSLWLHCHKPLNYNAVPLWHGQLYVKYSQSTLHSASVRSEPLTVFLLIVFYAMTCWGYPAKRALSAMHKHGG